MDQMFGWFGEDYCIPSLVSGPTHKTTSSVPSLVSRPHPQNQERGLVSFAKIPICAESAN